MVRAGSTEAVTVTSHGASGLPSQVWQSRDSVQPQPQQRVGSLSTPVPVVDPAVTIPELDRRFRLQPELRAVLTRSGTGWHLLSRAVLDGLLSGRFGYGRALLERRTLADVLPLDTLVLDADASLQDAAQAVLTRGAARRFEDVVVVSGSDVAITPVAAIFAGLADLYRDAASTDLLTGLPNRLGLAERLAPGRSALPSGGMAVLYVDLDRFKAVNDRFGHRAGDLLLAEFAGRLMECIRPGDLVARLGGDEFAVILFEVDAAQAQAVSERIVLSAATPFIVDTHLVAVGASVGVAVASDPQEKASSIERLLRLADTAMYQAKRTGGSKWSRALSSSSAIPGLVDRLVDSLRRDELQVHFQPIMSLATERVTGVEALCRWQDRLLGLVPPDRFIAAAEKSGVISELGRWTLAAACRQAAQWLKEGRDLTVAVNVSPLELVDGDFTAAVARTLATSGVPARQLQLEITESAAIDDLQDCRQQLADLRALGVRLALDDFGTSYSSLSLLRTLPIDALKIDKSFIANVDLDTNDAAVVAMVIDGARRLGLTTVAEGVERVGQLNRLRELRCDAAQGFLIGRPAPAAALPFGTAFRSPSS